MEIGSRAGKMEKTTMKLTKKTIATITLILTLTFSATFVALAAVYAQDFPVESPTWTFISVSRNPIGVGQEIFIVFWLQSTPPTASKMWGDRYTFEVDVTKPDGSKQTIGPITSDPVGGGYRMFTPAQVGTYTLVAKHLGTTFTGVPGREDDKWVGSTYLASESEPLELIVQEEPIEPWHEAPLTTEYWERPIYGASHSWHVLAGNWLAGAAHNVNSTARFVYGEGPESPHILWSTPMWAGGLMDPRLGTYNYDTVHYHGVGFTPPIILNGIIYYNVQSHPREGHVARDLYTGEELYWSEHTLSFGQILYISNPNQHGGFPYLWKVPGRGDPDPNWYMYDAFTGKELCQIANASTSGTAFVDDIGSICRVRFTKIGGVQHLQVWNSTHVIYKPEAWQWKPAAGTTYDGNLGFTVNVTLDGTGGRSQPPAGKILTVRANEFIIGGVIGENREDEPVEQGHLWALSLKPGEEGRLLWNITFTPPPAQPFAGKYSQTYGKRTGPYVQTEDGTLTFWCSMTRRWWGDSLETGELLWGPTDPESQMKV